MEHSSCLLFLPHSLTSSGFSCGFYDVSKRRHWTLLTSRRSGRTSRAQQGFFAHIWSGGCAVIYTVPCLPLICDCHSSVCGADSVGMSLSLSYRPCSLFALDASHLQTAAERPITVIKCNQNGTPTLRRFLSDICKLAGILTGMQRSFEARTAACINLTWDWWEPPICNASSAIQRKFIFIPNSPGLLHNGTNPTEC